MNQVIIYQSDDGKAAVIIPILDCGLTIEEIAVKDVPAGKKYIIVDADTLPADETLFFNSWEMSDQTVVANIDKAKAIGHDIRRAARSEEFKPLDVQATIPSLAAQAEAARQVIREKYAAMQADIDAASTTDEIKEALK